MLLLTTQCQLLLCPPSNLGLGRRHVFETTMEFLEATFLGRINTSLQGPNTSDVIAGERVNMPEGLVNQTLELGGLLNEPFHWQTFNCRPLEKCCGEDIMLDAIFLITKESDSDYLQSLKTAISAKALARFARSAELQGEDQGEKV